MIESSTIDGVIDSVVDGEIDGAINYIGKLHAELKTYSVPYSDDRFEEAIDHFEEFIELDATGENWRLWARKHMTKKKPPCDFFGVYKCKFYLLCWSNDIKGGEIK